MKKKILTAMIAAALLAMLTACGSSGDTDKTASSDAKQQTSQISENTKQESDNTVELSSDEEALAALTGTPLSDAMAKISDLGYKATYYADGVDFTEFIDDVKDDYTTGDIKVNTADKTVDVTLELTSNLQLKDAEKALSEKLSVGAAWGAAEKYGKAQYGHSFDLNYLTGKIAATAEDENTWYLKAECKANGKDATCEAKVSGTTGSPEIVSFDVY